MRSSNNLQDPLDILKSSADMYESSGSQLLRTTTGIQSGPDPFDESRFVMTFLKLVFAIFHQFFIFSST